MNKKFKQLITGILSLTLAFSLTACGGAAAPSGGTAPAAGSTAPAAGGAAPAPAEKINIRIASSSPTVEFNGEGTTALGVCVNYFVKEIAARTNGRITAKVFPDGQLASTPEEYIGGLQSGSFDIGIMNNGSWSDYTHAFAGLNIPYLYFDFETVYAVLDSELGQGWRQKAEADTTVIPLAYFDIGFRELTNSLREVRTPDDLKGIKLRTMVDDIQMAAWSALGTAVTPVAYSELYTALQQKMVDGQENPVSNIVSSKVYELQPYMTITNHNYTATIPAASPILWSKLSAEDQQLIKDLMIEAQNKGREKTQVFADGFLKTIADSGVQIYEPTTAELQQFQSKVKTVWTKVEENMGTEEFNKLIKFVDDYMAGKK